MNYNKIKNEHMNSQKIISNANEVELGSDNKVIDLM